MDISDFIKTGDFTLKSGEKSDKYVDLKSIISFPEFHNNICDKIIEKIGKKPDLICGAPYGAIPLASIISSRELIPMLLIRKEQKKHGLGKIIEGNFTKGQNIIVLEDVVTTGKSVIDVCELLESMGLNVEKIIAILSRSKNIIKFKNIHIESIYNLHNL